MSHQPNPAGIRFANFIREIVEAGSVHPADASFLSPIRCIRRPSRKPCKGRIRVTPRLDALVWQCSECESCGEISGWRESGGDFSQFIPDDGDRRLLLGLSEDEYRMVRDAIADTCEEAAAVAGAIWADNEVVISGSPETFESIANTVFDEALVATSMKTHKLLHALSKKSDFGLQIRSGIGACDAARLCIHSSTSALMPFPDSSSPLVPKTEPLATVIR